MRRRFLVLPGALDDGQFLADSVAGLFGARAVDVFVGDSLSRL